MAEGKFKHWKTGEIIEGYLPDAFLDIYERVEEESEPETAEKVRIGDLASEFGFDSTAPVIEVAEALGIEGLKPQSSVTAEEAEKIKAEIEE